MLLKTDVLKNKTLSSKAHSPGHLHERNWDCSCIDCQITVEVDDYTEIEQVDSHWKERNIKSRFELSQSIAALSLYKPQLEPFEYFTCFLFSILLVNDDFLNSIVLELHEVD